MQSNILGIDIGSVSVHIAAIAVTKNKSAHITYTAAAFHNGEVKNTLSSLLEDPALKDIHYIAATDSTPSFVASQSRIDGQVAVIRAARHFHGHSFATLLHIGGEKFSLSLFDEAGNYTGARHNTSCAAGTGSFLDQQARRLNLAGSEQISLKALANTKSRPDIATRCAVFAKTDLIHAQQEGYDIEQICDGLCYGLAKNISNTLFKKKINKGKLIFCGGVSQNRAVTAHLEKIIGHDLFIDEFSCFYGAMGAAFCLLDELADTNLSPISKDLPGAVFLSDTRNSVYEYPPLELNLSDYPDFSSFKSYEFEGVESDVYTDPNTLEISHGYLGLDVGSTSTKCIIVNQDGAPIAGFYTKTASRPVQAVQKLFKACHHFLRDFQLNFPIKGCGTTGSGRRISGRIIGADIEPDEITAHATAAVNLNSNVDTIIEIGGQDAKFTLLKDGMVTSSVMNTVCAAGTGSFIEEQALKLNCPLSEYSARAEGVKAPVSSDRCTVFMERDINYYFAEGYGKDEILASVLHSVRDNYLTKVATESKIGSCVLFQGATARNKALVAAFEQKLNRPIHVSRFCHLTGALGVALLAMEENVSLSKFRGFDLWKLEIPVRQEVCRLCTNHCKLTIAELEDGPQAYGFLCGRDYDTQKMVPRKTRFNLLKDRKKITRQTDSPPPKHDFTIGLPAALHMFEDLEFWQFFFSRLGIKTKTSLNLKQPVKIGKNIAAAEFCAPVTAFHAHISHLLDCTDYVFLPFYFEDKTRVKGTRRQHCYYTQFAPSTISCLENMDGERILSPTIRYLYTNFHTKMELYRALKKISPDFLFSFFDIGSAWDKAVEFKNQNKLKLREYFQKTMDTTEGIKVLLLGRPYTVLSDSMNNNIPRIFENLNVPVFFQDMLAREDHDLSMLRPLLGEIHWKHAAGILEAAYMAANTPGLFPVYVTSFKCSPDSFAVDYFKKIMEKFNKPYLVLELDEHDSSVGYETRIEAAVRAFTNHHVQPAKPEALAGPLFDNACARSLDNKTIIFPNWDRFSGELIVSTFKNEGIHALLMEETRETLKRCMLTNTGQCIPLNAVAAGFIHTVEKNGLDPENTILWLNESDIACNIKMYPFHIKQILEREGRGFEQAGIYLGELSLFDISFKASINAYFAYMFGGLLRSMGCKIRPYEIHAGETDQALDQALAIISAAFLTGGSKEKALKEAVSLISKVQTRQKGGRPKVAIFGDLYVRDNDLMNQDLIHFIEKNGGEVVITPYYKYIKIIANSYFRKWFKEGKYLSLISNRALFVAMNAMEKKYYKYFEPILNEKDLEVGQGYENILEQYGILPEHTGESMDNILKIHHIVNEHPDLALLVQTNPAFCCPGLVTEAMAAKLEEKTGVPIATITYDLSGGNKNKVIVPFLKYYKNKDYCQSRKVSV
ncbi:acyl-CoA dehydratase activase [Desulfospira joergensenii]|uniref:acyl-CoA dehydratase activase n=1 Tax=Desulfospira joergensenii TaxID=53329 RepID=UPI0003B5B604|nr:acyl-CoA dehydratase activase [Desulfospira joergensenii]